MVLRVGEQALGAEEDERGKEQTQAAGQLEADCLPGANQSQLNTASRDEITTYDPARRERSGWARGRYSALVASVVHCQTFNVTYIYSITLSGQVFARKMNDTTLE